MAIRLDGSGLDIATLVRIARDGEKVELAPDALERIRACRGLLERKIAAGEIMYGVNTGIGEFSEIVLDDDQVRQFQRYLIYNHAAGIGDPAPIEYVRGAMAGRINVHAHGNSGCRPEITLTLLEMLNKGVTPFVCQKGSVGACGDLAPMSQIALLLMGEGKAYYQGELLAGAEALARAGITAAGPGGPGRAGHHQRLEPADGHERHPPVGHGPLAAAGGDRRGHVPGGAAGQPQTLRRPPARGARLRRRGAQRGGHPPLHRRQRPGHRQGQDPGAGRLLHALDPPGDRRGPRRGGLGAEPGGDRAQRRGRQPHLLPRGRPDPDRRQLPGHAGVACPWRAPGRP